MNILRRILLSVAVSACAVSAQAEIDLKAFSLDSIETWGKFPRFAVKVYKAVAARVNDFDSTYVVDTGYNMGVKITTDTWGEDYKFLIHDHNYMSMRTWSSSSVGVHANIYSLSIGYDINASKLVRGFEGTRHRVRYGFTCSLLSVEGYYIRNDVGASITRFGPWRDPAHVDVDFHGCRTRNWGVTAYYFFNHRRYSEAAAFNFNRIQRRSQGTFSAGVSVYGQRLSFDFSQLPPDMRDQLPHIWPEYTYEVDCTNYAIRGGYSYNWVFHPEWTLAVRESPSIGLRYGTISGTDSRVTCSLFNTVCGSIVYNRDKWYMGGTCIFDTAIVNDKRTTYAGNTFSAEFVIGYRFNLF